MKRVVNSQKNVYCLYVRIAGPSQPREPKTRSAKAASGIPVPAIYPYPAQQQHQDRVTQTELPGNQGARQYQDRPPFPIPSLVSFDVGYPLVKLSLQSQYLVLIRTRNL